MAYSARETSADSARPIELYEFNREGQAWRYTSSDEPFTLSGATYNPAVIERSGLEQGTEMNRAALTLNVQRDLEIAALYQAGPPSDVITLILRQIHIDDSEARLLWSGRIITVNTWENGKAKIFLEPVYTSLRRNGLRRLYQKACPHVLYGPACNASNAVFRVVGVCAGVSGLSITIPQAQGFPAGWFAGGYLEWQTSPGIFERRFIESHNGNSVIVTVSPVGLLADVEIRLYPGCDHLISTCNSKFNNAANFGGMPFIPSLNPFGSTPIY